MRSGVEHAQNLGIDMAALSNARHGSIVIGEWSAALHAEHRPENATDEQRRAFCRAELDMFERFTAGWFFWTYKVHRWLYDQNRHEDWDSGWSAMSACQADVLPQWAGFQVRNSQVQGDGGKGQRLKAALGQYNLLWGHMLSTTLMNDRPPSRHTCRLLESAWKGQHGTRPIRSWSESGLGRRPDVHQHLRTTWFWAKIHIAHWLCT